MRARRVFWLLFSAAIACLARQLPVKNYTTDDGLPRNEVYRIVADPGGLLWFCTAEGLSRFDGHQFVTYGRADGLPHPAVSRLLVTRGGTYWVGTGNGLARFQPQPGARRFWVYPIPRSTHRAEIRALLQDRGGALWIGASNGLYRLAQPDSAWPGELEAADSLRGAAVTDLAEGLDGSLWAATSAGLYSRDPAGMLQWQRAGHGLPGHFLPRTVLTDRRGRVWAGTDKGLYRLSRAPGGAAYRPDGVLTRKRGLASDAIRALHQTRDGRIWVGGAGLTELPPDGDGEEEPHIYTSEHGLAEEAVNSISEDPDGGLWLGGFSGATKVLRGGFHSYTSSDGLTSPSVFDIFEDLQGAIYAVNGSEQAVALLSGRSVVSVRPNYGSSVHNIGGRREQLALQDRSGDWWIATDRGLFRFTGVSQIGELETRTPDAVYGPGHGLSSRRIHRVYEDRRGNIWVACVMPFGLSVWSRGADSWRHFHDAPFDESAVWGFTETAKGDLWLAMDSGVARYLDGKFEVHGHDEGVPRSRILCVLADRAGRLWFGTRYHGLGRIDAPNESRFSVRLYSTANGLSSDLIISLVEDKEGRVYIGNGRGLDRLDPDSGTIRRYTAADGLIAGPVRTSHRDRTGRLWFGTQNGVSEFVPEDEMAVPLPRVLITGIRVRGNPVPISELGETQVPEFTLSPADNQVEFQFVGLGTRTLRYQYRLSGSSGEWSPPGADQSLRFASLAPGAYGFDVRAVTTDGKQISEPASAHFVLLAPMWRRWWFGVLAAIAVAAVAYAWHRRRLARVAELERIRTRIATDLHDDIGSSLSQIAILTEVVHRNAQAGASDANGILSEIAGTARELVDSMSDIVWAIDPEHDHIGDLTHRMRRFAEDLCSASDIALTFRGPDSGKAAAGALVRRQIHLVMKETLNNVVRHSKCDRVRIEFWLEGGDLRLTVADNGRGFDAAAAYHGHGLKSIRDRALRLGGSVEWQSGANGTTVEFRAPLGALTPRTA